VKKLLLVLSVLTCFTVAQAQDAGQGHAKKPKKIKKTVTTTTTTEEVEDDGSPKTEKTEATTQEVEPTPTHTQGGFGNLPSINESWYTLWGLGFSKTKYKGDIGDSFEDASSAGSRSTGIAMDLLGFYWPLSDQKTMIGVIINGSADSVKLDGVTDRITTTLLAFSVHHFFGQNIGDGFFVRGDIGFSSANIEVEESGFKWDKSSDSTLGVLFGGGYAWPINLDTRMLLGLYIRPLPNYKIKDDFGDTGHLKGTTSSLILSFLF
jgi:hypothetical protein